MATPLVDLERLAVHSPRTFHVRKNFHTSILSGSRGLRGSWKFSSVAQGLALGVTRLEQHERNRRRVLIRAKKEGSHNGGPRENRGPELKFDSTDMLELEFGRLLGEDRETTLAKVLGKKMDPDLTYVKIEKEKELQEEKESARLSSPSKISAPVRQDVKRKEKTKDYPTPTLEPGVPNLISPPVRTPGFEKVDASPVQTIRVPPSVRSGGGKKSVDADPHAVEGLIRKPMRVSEAEKGLPPARPEKSIIAPMLMRKQTDLVDIQPKPGDSLLRRPSSGRLNAFGDSIISYQIPPSTSVEEVELAGAVEPDDISEEKFRQLLDGELSLARQGEQSTASKTSVSVKIPPTVRPVLPSLEKKPTILKPQIVDSSENLMNELANSTSSAGVESGSVLQDAELPNPRPTVSSRPRAKPSKPHLVRPQTNPEVTVVNEVPRDKNEENIVVKVKPDSAISLEERTLKVQVAETILHKDTCPVNTSGEDPEDDSEDATNSLPIIKLERVDTLLGDVDVQGSTKKDGISEAVARKSVMRLRKTGLPLQQPALSKATASLVDSTSPDTTSAQDTYVEDEAIPAPNSAVEREEEEGIMVRGHGIKEEQQENTLLKTRQPPPVLKLSRPAPRGAFTSKKDAQVDTTLINLQRAISSFDERRMMPNKKENIEDWARAEALRDSKAIEELEIIGTGRGGLLVGFGSLVGYLPAFELKAERRPVSFSGWAQSKGYDAKRKKSTQDEENQNNGGFKITSMESTTSSVAQDSGGLVDALEQRSSKPIDPEQLEQFKNERAAALSLLVGQKAKVIVILVDKTLRQLRFSEKQAEGEGQELSQRKITLMESMNVGDVVTCQVKKITTFGAFVDLKGVSALIHSTELSWNRNTDPLSVLQVGQEVKAKVCKLDRFLQRINLSLKLMQPDPLLETLESLISPCADMIGSSAGAKVEENEDLNRFIRKLEQIPEIVAVSSGRRVRGAALAPAFQIYLSGHLDNGYKLLARFGNEVQEVLVETSANRERMKDFIRDCTVQDT